MKPENKTILALVLGLSLLIASCRDSAKGSAVMFVDQSNVFPDQGPEQRANPLILLVEISGEGKLSLNRIETGSIDDTTILSERMTTVFKDREKSSIREREVVVEMKGSVAGKDLENLIDMLEGVNASPIRVIKK